MGLFVIVSCACGYFAMLAWFRIVTLVVSILAISAMLGLGMIRASFGLPPNGRAWSVILGGILFIAGLLTLAFSVSLSVIAVPVSIIMQLVAMGLH